MTMSYAGTGGQLRAPKVEGMGSNLGVTWRRLIDSNIGGGFYLDLRFLGDYELKGHGFKSWHWLVLGSL